MPQLNRASNPARPPVPEEQSNKVEKNTDTFYTDILRRAAAVARARASIGMSTMEGGAGSLRGPVAAFSFSLAAASFLSALSDFLSLSLMAAANFLSRSASERSWAASSFSREDRAFSRASTACSRACTEACTCGSSAAILELCELSSAMSLEPSSTLGMRSGGAKLRAGVITRGKDARRCVVREARCNSKHKTRAYY